MLLDCPANVVTLSSGELACQDGMGGAVAWLVTPSFDLDQLDPEMLAAAFAAGFVIVGTAWAIGKGARIVLSMLGR